MTIADLARPEIRELRPYAAAAQVEDTIRLNANEAPWASRADNFRRPLNRYPEIRPARLGNIMASRFGCRAQQLLVTRGTSEAIDLLIRAFCRANVDSIVATQPTFSMYGHYAAIQGASVTCVPTDPERNFAVIADEVLAGCDASTRLVFLCTPNNPTGTSVSRESIEAIAAGCADRAAVVVDEAYIEFSREASCADLLDAHNNLVVLRTLSKALAFAGARCGAVLGSTELIGMLDAIQAPYALATPVVECVENALQDDRLQEAERQIDEIVTERARLFDALQSFDNIDYIWPSDANFLLMKVNDLQAVLEQAQTDRVLLRYFGAPLTDCVRVSIGSTEENERLLDSISKLGVRSG